MKGTTMKRSQTIWPGIVLVVIGLLLLVNRLDIFVLDWHVTWPVLVILLGVYFFTRVPRDRGAVFPGVLFFLSGILFLARNMGLYYSYLDVSIGGLLMIILGLAFVALYIVRSDNWGLLIPAGLFLFFGLIIWSDQAGLIDWYTRRQLMRLWPVLLILVGVGIIISSLRSTGQQDGTPPPAKDSDAPPQEMPHEEGQ